MTDVVVVVIVARSPAHYSRAYTTVSVSHVASCLGMSEAEAKHTAEGLGWELDAPAGMLTVVQPPVSERQQLAMDSLQKLTEYTMHLSDFAADNES